MSGGRVLLIRRGGARRSWAAAMCSWRVDALPEAQGVTFDDGGGWREGHRAGVCAEGEGEVPLGESLDDGDARGRRFPVGGVMLPPLSHLPPWVKTLSFLGRAMAAFSAPYPS